MYKRLNNGRLTPLFERGVAAGDGVCDIYNALQFVNNTF